MKKLFYYLSIVLLIQACKKSTDDATYSVDTTTESAQQVGDVTASVDESGGNTNGSMTVVKSELKSFEKAFARRISCRSCSKTSRRFKPLSFQFACNYSHDKKAMVGKKRWSNVDDATALKFPQ